MCAYMHCVCVAVCVRTVHALCVAVRMCTYMHCMRVCVLLPPGWS